MTHHRLARVALGAVAGVLAVLAGLIIDPSAHVAEADTDVNKSTVNFHLWGHIARNIIVGNSIEVCAADYPNTTGAAVKMWNDALHAHKAEDDRNVFTVVSQCQDDPTSEHIEYVSVESRNPTDVDFFCSPTSDGTMPNACFLVPPRSLHPHYTFTGRLLVVVNAVRRPPMSDGLAENTPAYMELRRTVAHELGHVFGLGDHPCTASVDSLMACAVQVPEHSPYPLKPVDLKDFGDIYKPNTVTGVPNPVAPVLVTALSGHTGTIVVSFDARNVVTEKQIELRRWESTTSRWEILGRFAPESRLVTRVIRGQPSGTQKYRIFSTSEAYINGQCAINDADCDASNNADDWVAGAPIGFGTASPAIEVHAAGTAKSLLYAEVTGLGTVEAKRNTPGAVAQIPPVGYDLNEPVTLTAKPATDTYTCRQNCHPAHSATATLSEFAGWGGACSGAAPTCTLTMDADKTATARFVPIEHDLTIELPEGAGLSSYPRGGMHTYTAGTFVLIRLAWDKETHDFDKWLGCIPWSGGPERCRVYMDGDKTVRALFGPPLDTLSLSDVPADAWSPAFNPDIADYEVDVDSDLGQTTVAATASGQGVEVQITDPADADTTAAGHQVDVSATAPTQITVVVMRDKKFSRTYTVTVTPRNVRLSNLTLSGVTLSPDFASGVLTYSDRVGSSVSQTTVTATVAHSSATATITPADADPLTGHQVALARGQTTTIELRVTYEGALRVYTVAVTRRSPPRPPPRLC